MAPAPRGPDTLPILDTESALGLGGTVNTRFNFPTVAVVIKDGESRRGNVSGRLVFTVTPPPSAMRSDVSSGTNVRKPST